MKVFQIALGVILLLPGLCSLGFMIEVGLSPGLQITSFAISAFGVWLISNAGDRP